MKRKEFLQSIFRFSILFLMGFVVSIFIKKGKITADEDCNSDFQCRNCNKLKDCSIEEANKYKSNG